MTWNYQIFKFTSKDFDDITMADQRNKAPLYGLFQVYKKEDGSIWGRNSSPELIWDSYMEEETDPVKVFSDMLDRMKGDIQRPIIDHDTMVYSELSDVEEDEYEESDDDYEEIK